MRGEKRNDHRMRVSDGGGARLPVSGRKGRVNLRGAATAVFLACAAGSAASLWGVQPANAESAGILSEFSPNLGAGLSLGPPVPLTADTISYDEETGVALAEGNLEVGFGTQTIRADRSRNATKTGGGGIGDHRDLHSFPTRRSSDLLTADTISYDEETGVALAEGNLEVGFGTQTIRS